MMGLVEANAAIFRIDAYGGAFRVFAGEDGHAERVEQVMLNRSLEGAGAIHGVIAVVCYQLCSGIGELHLEAAGGQSLAHTLELNADDVFEVIGLQAVEDDDIVHTVEKLGAEVPAQGI